MLRKVPLLSFTDITADELVKKNKIKTRYYGCVFTAEHISKWLIILINAAQSCSGRSRLLRQETDSRCQLAVVEQVLQRITTAEFIHQTWQVADNSWRVWGVNVTWYITHLYHGDVPIGIKALRCRNLIRETEIFKLI